MKQQMNIEEINAFICKMADKDVVGISIASSVQDCLRKIGLSVDEGVIKRIGGNRFNVGDWIVGPKNSIFQVIEINAFQYKLCNLEGKTEDNSINAVDRYASPWSLKGAKEGDILAYRDGQWIFIYKKLVDGDTFCYHALYSTIHQDLTIDDAAFTLLSDAVVPATYEQRQILFGKLKDLGYYWDAENKNLHKVGIDVASPEGDKSSIVLREQTDIKEIRPWKFIADDVLRVWLGIGQRLDDGRMEDVARNLSKAARKQILSEISVTEMTTAYKKKVRFTSTDEIIGYTRGIKDIIEAISKA